MRQRSYASPYGFVNSAAEASLSDALLRCLVCLPGPCALSCGAGVGRFARHSGRVLHCAAAGRVLMCMFWGPIQAG